MTNIIQPSRRGFITGLASLIVAPAIVRIDSLMPVKVIKPDYMTGTEMLARFNVGLDLIREQMEWNILYTGRAFVLTNPEGIAKLINNEDIYLNDKS